MSRSRLPRHGSGRRNRRRFDAGSIFTTQERAMTDRTTSPALSRRSVLHLAIAGGGMALAGTVATPAAAAKIPQKSAHYQGTPKGKARCDGCRQWQAPAACKVV